MVWQSPGRTLLIVLLLAFLCRAGTAVGLQSVLDHRLHRQFLIEGDANGYWELGERIVAGEDYSLHHPPRRVHRMPGFPLILAASQWMSGGNFLFTRIVLAVVGTVACGLVYVMGRDLFSPEVGLWSALCCAISPTMVGFSVLILSETAFAAAMMFNLVAATKLMLTTLEKRALLWGWAAATGVGVALATLMRPSWILAAPIFSGIVLFRLSGRKNWVSVGIAAVLIPLAMLVVLFPWAWRNQRVEGHWTWTTLWAGPSLYDGLNPEATGDSDMRFFDRDHLMKTMTEYEVDQHYRKKAKEYALEHPWRTIELAGLKLVRYWKPWPNAEQFDRWWMKLLVASFFLPMMILAVIGSWQARQTFWKLLLTAGPIFYFMAIHAVFVGSLRYRLPAEYPLCILTALGLQSLLVFLRRSPDPVTS